MLARQTQITILGVDLRRRIVSLVNGLGRGDRIRVIFRGTRAYTDGKTIVLPAIRDLAEIPYATARALIGYAIHEVAHIRYTDFEQVARAAAAGKLVKKFENCIEDYRIERIMSRAYIGTAPDLTALRVAIHPKLNSLTTGWFADPRACGPLALTWTGSRLNNFPNPHLQATLDAFPAPVFALIEDWTERMKDCASTEEAVDLAIVFEAEAHAYAARTQLPMPATAPPPPPAANENDEPDDGVNDADQTSPPADDQESPETDADTEKSENPSDAESDNDPALSDDANADSSSADNSASDSDLDENAAEVVGDSGGAEEDSSNAKASVGDSDHTQPSTSVEADNDEAIAPDGAGETPATPASDSEKPGRNPSQDDGAESLDFGGTGATSSGSGKTGAGSPSSDGQIDMNGDLTDEFGGDGKPAQGSGDASPPSSAQQSADIDPVQQGREDDAEGDAPINGPAFDESGDDAGGTSDDPFSDVLESRASFDDFLDDLAEQIAEQGALPDDAPEAADGEVDPSEVMNDVADANKAAPSYTSNAGDQGEGECDSAGPGASKHHYDDARFSPVEEADGCLEQYDVLRGQAAGTISTTARTIKRLLMAEEQKGVLRNRRSGQFDIRNMSAIVRGTGTCYRKPWEKPSPKTLLCTLTDFSGSMMHSWASQSTIPPINLAMMGTLAIEQATAGTSVNTAMYGYTGYSPHVDLFAFKEGKQSSVLTRRRIGSYHNVDMNCTPTGEAMAALAMRMEDAEEDRKILLVLTDGSADDMPLCGEVSRILIKRGIEVVAIGICNDSVSQWAPVYHIIHDITQLPQALLATIDPRFAKKRMRAAA